MARLHQPVGFRKLQRWHCCQGIGHPAAMGAASGQYGPTVHFATAGLPAADLADLAADFARRQLEILARLKHLNRIHTHGI